MAAEFTGAQRDLVVRNLMASARWLGLIASRLEAEGEAEAAALTTAAADDITEVCSRLQRTTPAGT